MRIKNIIKLNAVDSTNNYARGQVLHKESEEGTVVLARHQINGRGYGNNFWESEKGKNLTFSILLKPVFLKPANQFFLSMSVSLGIFDFVAGEVESVKIKWPNDIFVSEKKMGGILIENTISGNKISDSIIGIGLNINQEKFTGDAPNPISLKQLTGKEYNLDSCLEIIYTNIIKWYDLLKSGKFELISETYVLNLFRFNEWANYKAGNKTFNGKITGIDEFGQLQIETADKQILLFQFKEVGYVFTDTEV